MDGVTPQSLTTRLNKARRKDRQEEKKDQTTQLARAAQRRAEMSHVGKQSLEDALAKRASNYDIANIEILQTLQECFKGHVYRRTINSKDWQGQPIWGAVPIFTSTITLNLRDEEMDVLHSVADDAYNDKKGGDWAAVSDRLEIVISLGMSATGRH